MAEGGEVGRREAWNMEIGTPLPLGSRNTQAGPMIIPAPTYYFYNQVLGAVLNAL